MNPFLRFMKKLSLLSAAGGSSAHRKRKCFSSRAGGEGICSWGMMRKTRDTWPCGSSAMQRSWGSKAMNRWHFEWRRWCRIYILRCERRAQCDDGVSSALALRAISRKCFSRACVSSARS
jgi:hypothetical protein